MQGIETANGHGYDFVPEDNSILIVNDEPDQLSLMGSLLRKAGYSVLTAEDGLEGLSLARLEQPDLVISDVSMPRMDGLEFCREIRADCRTENCSDSACQCASERYGKRRCRPESRRRRLSGNSV